jgi:uncharacterized membrane protein YkvA (DUF1232 family)
MLRSRDLERDAAPNHVTAMTRLLVRFITFRNELATLWRAFLAPETPMHLKALMLLVPAYLLSPLDLVPDFIPLLGWLDDFIVVPLLVSWIVAMLPRRAEAYRAADGGKVIDGTYRRR